LSLKKYLHIVRINLFARFMGLLENKANYSVDEFNKYIDGIDFIQNSKMGNTISNNEVDAKHYTPFLRILEYVKTFAEGKINMEEYTEFKREFEPLKENDSKYINRYGIIDIDLSMTKVLSKYRLICNRTKGFVVNAFRAADLDGDRLCNLQEFFLLYRYIEAEKYDKEFCEHLFKSYSDGGSGKEITMSFDKFTVLCVEYQLFSDQQQDKFLIITSKEEVEKQYQDLRSNWWDKTLDLRKSLKMLEKCPQVEKDYWLRILDCIEERINRENQEGNLNKPILIAFKILCSEVKILTEQEDDTKQNEY